MLRLNLAREPYWLDLGRGVRVRVDPLTTALMVAARSDPEVRDRWSPRADRASSKIRTIVAKMGWPRQRSLAQSDAPCPFFSPRSAAATSSSDDMDELAQSASRSRIASKTSLWDVIVAS